MHRLPSVLSSLSSFAARMVPRVLSQISRDPGSATYGCCDRNWWHYKIRDFPSIILQQAGYAAWIASRLPEWHEQRDELGKLAAAAGRFWNARALRRGAFEEYYPWEQGYPPLAFSTLAIMKLVACGIVDRSTVEAGAREAAAQLTGRFEAKAANQQVAGLAALAWLRKAFPKLVSEEQYTTLRDATLALQHSEGWYVEYGGPDLGYLAVTIDCLWDLYDATGDRRYIESAHSALNFIASLVVPMNGGIGMHNARNTDYLVPYGIARFVCEGGPAKPAALAVLVTLFDHADGPNHFLQAVDDRYLCHYTGHSVLRALLELRALPPDLPEPATMPPPKPALLLPGCGYWLDVSPARRVLVSLRKGGILTAHGPRSSSADFGWIVKTGGRTYVTHWWSDRWAWEKTTDGFIVRGPLVPHKEHLSTPAKHMALRLASLVMGRRLIGSLKGQLIFQNQDAPFRFERKIALLPDRIVVQDQIVGLPGDAAVTPAPRSSKRHVASADSYHGEDLTLARLAVVDRTTRLESGRFTAETIYSNL